ncbi:MAG: twin-arginine translocase TatA/TatE family subunit [Planctomycetota bacterium]|nr:MAG: twin-arginine translocase TatA/TatE family subunit [Planctomycetota bacterium]
MVQTLAFGLPHGFEWLIILLVALLIFGPRLPRIMRGLGSSVREFRGGMEQGDPNEANAPSADTSSSESTNSAATNDSRGEERREA